VTIDIRPLTAEDLPSAMQLMARYFAVEPPSQRRITNAIECWDEGRQFGAFDDDRIVAMAGAWGLATTVPGPVTLPTLGLTRVGVMATHRRQGILTELVRTQFTDSLGRGDVLSSLRASEAPIYGRFGYGLAGHITTYRIKSRDGAFAIPLNDTGSMRLLEPSEVFATLPDIYDRVGRAHVGAVSRPEGLWRNYLASFQAETFASAEWVAVHVAADGTLDGYVHFEAVDRDNWDKNGNLVEVRDLVADDPDAYAALWRFLFEYDLVETIKAQDRPDDEWLRYRLVNGRALEVVDRYDEQWVRLLDVDQAVRGRAYNDAGSVNVAVTDSFLPSNSGTYRLGAASGLVDESPDLALDVSALGAVYMGGTSFAELAAARRITEFRSGLIARADAICTTRPAPWCGSFF
jgi:predicted acetyltransferase